MNADHVNPFIQGAQSVLTQFCGNKPNLGKLYLKNAPYDASPVNIHVSIIGGLQGTMLLGMDESVGCFLASKMMGMQPPALDEISQSALSELANIISGNVATIFSGKGSLVDITTPNFVRGGTSADFPMLQKNVVCIPLSLDGGMVVELNVWIG